MDIKIITAIVGSSVLSAIITSLFTKSSKDKSNKLQYITNERKLWRDDIRKAAVEVRKEGGDKQKEIMFKTIQEAKTYFQVRLNPEDAEDNKLLECFDISKNTISNNFEEYVARLLKHDWERVKKESDQHFLKIYYVIIAFATLIILLYPITDWPGLKEQPANITTLNSQTVLKGIVSLKALLFLILFPMLFPIINGSWMLLLKSINLSTKHECQKAAICSWLKIPYRGIINSEEKK